MTLFASLRGYQARWLGLDSLAALTLLVIAIPEQLATSRLAGMPLITGYYAFIAGTIAFAVLGSNPQLSVGADSTVAPLFAVAIARLAPGGSAAYRDRVAVLAVAVGLTVALVGVLRLGWIADFLSTPIITGFLAGVAVIIAVHQLPDLLGVAGGGGSTVHRLHVLVRNIGDTNGWTVGVGLAVLVVVIGGELIDRRVPGALIGLVASTLVVRTALLQHHGVAVIGRFPHGAPHWGLTGFSWSELRGVLPATWVVALVVLSQSAATTRAFADQGGYDVDVSRDFLGVGAGSVLAGLAGAFPVNASPPRTAAVASARGRTQAAGLIAAAALAVLVPAAGVLADVPVATLAAVLLFVAGRLFHTRDLRAITRFDWFESGLTAVTFLTVAFVGVEEGIGVAVALAILDRARLSAQPQLHVLGRIPGTTSWVPLSSGERTEEIPGLLVVLFATPLWYGNATHFRNQMSRALARTDSSPRTVVLDAIGMSDIDFTGSRALSHVLDELQTRHIRFAMARAGARTRRSLEHSGLLARIGDDQVFATVGEAVQALSG